MRSLSLLACAFALVLFSCQDQGIETLPNQTSQKSLTISVPEALQNLDLPVNGRVSDLEVAVADQLNEILFADGNIKISKVDIYQAATVVETIDQQFESTLSSRWLPGDARRNWNGDGDLDDIDWIGVAPFAIANGTFDVFPTYRSMYDKWENDGFCNTVSIQETPFDIFSQGNPSLILQIGGPPAALPFADINILGFLPAGIFEAVLGAENILGVAFSFVFLDENGDPTSGARGKDDKAYAEVWFNDGFTWSFGPQGGIDIESVVLHEFGHTLNLGHFGILQSFTDTETGAVDFVYQPVNTMNALYIGESRNFLGPNDKGNYCEAWGSWPWN